MRWLIFGGFGQLGSELGRVLAERGGQEVFRHSSDVDIRNPDAVRAAIDKAGPDVIMNAAAYNFVDRAETEVRAAFEINAFAVRDLARACEEGKRNFVHVSTNFVFDGRSRRPYRETDRPHPVNSYALSKRAGEFWALRECARGFVIRSSGLYGRSESPRSKQNFVEQMLEKSCGSGEIRVVRDQVMTPTSCRDLARAIVDLVGTRRFGLYHVTNSGSCSWARFARKIFSQTGIRPRRFSAVTTDSFGAPAPRPRYTVLSCSKYRAAGCKPLRGWEEALADYLRERSVNDSSLRRPLGG